MDGNSPKNHQNLVKSPKWVNLPKMAQKGLPKRLYFKAESARGAQGAFFTKNERKLVNFTEFSYFSGFSENSIIS